MNGIYELRPSLPRYTATWDLRTVLNYFRKGASVYISAFLEGFDFKVNLFVNPFEWTKVSDSQILFNQKYGVFRPQMYFCYY